MRSLHRVPSTEKKIPSSEKRLSVPIYPELEIVKDETKTTEEENNLLCGDLERLNGRIPTVSLHQHSHQLIIKIIFFFFYLFIYW